MEKAVFLDRDGVLNDNSGKYYVYRKEDFALNKGVIEALSDLRKRGFLLIVITNQGGISKGITTHAQVQHLHEEMVRELTESGIHLSEIYYCPHHPDIEKCLCNKPGSLLLEKAIARFNISVKDSFFIGDSDRDIHAAERVGLNPVRIESNQNLLSVLQNMMR